MQRLFAVAVLTFLFCACKTNDDTTIVVGNQLIDEWKRPDDSLAFYFPRNSFHQKPKHDSFVQSWYGSALYNFNEPILHQSNIKHDVYRLLWLRSFENPVCISIAKSEGVVWLTTKILDRQPQFEDDYAGVYPGIDLRLYFNEGYMVDSSRTDMLVRKADRCANMIFDQTRMLSLKEWNKFESMLREINYWEIAVYQIPTISDGANWTIEANVKEHYHFVSRPGSAYELGEAGKYLIKLSKLKERVY
ncbi:hypothetical protein [Paracnuella aquatica]|uniref:hypothetical protein n=1 Tax=Paracnuella aquatica TaxID=2268757 RepID=UPI000DEFA6F8|nr:hypothetical protein [Paracnuella aquatica]RPD50654.1 hypothetical protein DRJ53_06960 [Paracnuella aquatica]